MAKNAENIWVNLSDKAFVRALSAVNAIHERSYFSPKTSVFTEKNLSFYNNYKFLKATETAAWPPLTMCFIYNDDDIIKIDYSIKPIEKANQKAPLKLDENNVRDYLDFFFSVVKDDNNQSFSLVETFSDIKFTDDYDEGLESTISEKLKPIIISNKNDGFSIKANLIYAENLYTAQINLDIDGKVEIDNEELICSKLPVRPIKLR